MKKLILISLSILAFTLSFLPQASLASTDQYGFTWVDRQTITSPSLGTFLLQKADPAPPTSGGLSGGLTDTGPQKITYQRQNDPDKCPDSFEVKINNDTNTDWSTGSYTYFPSAPYSPKDSNCHTDHVDVSVADGGNNYNILDWIDSATIRPLPQASGDLYGNTSDFVLDPATNEYVQQGSSACHSYIDNVSSSHTGGALHLSLDTNTDIPDKEYFILFQNCYQLKDNVTIRSLITGNYDHTIQNNILAVSFGNPANFATVGTPKAPSSGGAAATSDECATNLKSYAWIACPAYDSSNEFLTHIYEKFIVPLLRIGALDQASQSPLKNIVGVITGVANVFFIIVFLIMIFGTTLDLSSYTVKRTLPRLIIAAISIQFSYFICGAIIDVGNVLGGGIQDLVLRAIGGVDSNQGIISGILLGAGGTGLIASALFLGPAVLFILLSLVLAVLAFIFTLLVREIVIVMLIIAAPLAIAAAVLPNTEQYFKKWYQTLIRVVMVYPIISVILAAGAVAKVSIDSAKFPDGIGTVAGAIVGIIAFGMMPMAFKWGGSAMGIASKIGSKYSGANAGRSAAWSKGTAPGKDAYKGFKANSNAVKLEGFNNRFGNPEPGLIGSTRARIAGARLGNGFGNRTSGGAERYENAQRAARTAAQTKTEKLESEERKAEDRRVRDMPPADLLTEASAPTASQSTRDAAIDKLAQSGRTKELDAIQKTMTSRGQGDAFRSSLNRSSGSAKIREKAPHLAGGDYNNMSSAKLTKLDAVGAQAMMDHMKTLNDTRVAGTAIGATATQVADGLDAEGQINVFGGAIDGLSIDQKASIGPEVVKIIADGQDSAKNTVFDPAFQTGRINSKIDVIGGRFN